MPWMLERLELQLRRLAAGVEAGCALLGACAAVRLRPQATVAGTLRGALPGEPVPDALARRQWVQARQCYGRVRRAASLLPGEVTCLPRSLALFWLLRRRGIPAALRVGVRKNDAGLLAHAWVELRGEVVGEPALVAERYRAFPGRAVPRAERAP